MNGAKKFHSPDGPAFNKGEEWESCDGAGHRVTILTTERHGPAKWDVEVFYDTPNGPHSKGAWSFQVRYQHIADKEI